jgi:hypothetical protein
MSTTHEIPRASTPPKHEAPAYATAVSDAVLASAGVLASSRLLLAATVSVGGFDASNVAAWQLAAAAGMFIIGLAASFGTLRFAGVHRVIPVHEALAGIGMQFGTQLLGLSAAFGFERHPASSLLPVSLLVALLAAAIVFKTVRGAAPLRPPVVLLTTIIALVTLLARSALLLSEGAHSSHGGFFTPGVSGILGVMFVLLAGAVTTKGESRPLGMTCLPIMRNVDKFHYLMAIALVLLARMLLNGMPA